MQIRRHLLRVSTDAAIGFIDLSEEIRHWVKAMGVREGLLTVTTPHTTARIVCNEREDRLQSDFVRFLERLAPRDDAYAHNRETVDDRANAHAHLLSLLMPASESLPVHEGLLQLGSWQSVFLVELDGPREGREVHLQLIGE